MQTQWNDAPRREGERDEVADTVKGWKRSFGGSGPLRLLRRIGIGLVGSAVLGVGVVMLVMPGPAFVVIPLGLGILALEFEWAKRWLHRVREYVRNAMHAKRDRSTDGAPVTTCSAIPDGDRRSPHASRRSC